MPCNDCSRAEKCPPCVNEECEHRNKRYTGALYDGPNNRKSFLYYACPDCMKTWKEEEVDEPPMTPEEEEELTNDPGYDCANVSGCAYVAEDVTICKHGCRVAADELSREANEPPPPQPQRRPPFAVNYSVNGHLYQVAVSGDAAVHAIDGALVIRHHLGPVAGIVQVLPVIGEESE